MRIVGKPNVVRLDMHPAKFEVEGLTGNGVHFSLPNGEGFTLSVMAMRNIVAATEKWASSCLVEVSQRDKRIIGKGVVSIDEYPKLEGESADNDWLTAGVELDTLAKKFGLCRENFGGDILIHPGGSNCYWDKDADKWLETDESLRNRIRAIKAKL